MDAVEDIKGRLAIEDVIGEYIELKRAGRNWRGLSPFTNEKTASFMVSPEKQIWHDFSSSKGGNMFSFVMEMEGLDFRGALELLARKAGINLADYQTQRTKTYSQLKDRLYRIMEIATKYYQVQFSKNRQALEYILKTRGFTKTTALEWKIGYSPSDGTSLINYLRSKNINDQDIKQAGLTTTVRDGAKDMFRGRIMIPLSDSFGRVVGFTARQLRDDANGPKYINTSQTILYDKSRHIFGLHLAKDAIRKNNFAVLVEGNLDVIASHQADVRQVVATAGTALTEFNLKTLSRLTPNVKLCFDADRAGIAATERSIPIANKVGVNLSVISLSGVKDPDELIKQDPKKWEQAINNSDYAVDWLIGNYQKEIDVSTAQGKKRFSDIILATIKNLSDEVEKEHYIKKLSKILDVSQDALIAKMQPNKASHKFYRKPKPSAETLDQEMIEVKKAQDRLLALSLHQPKLRDFLLSIKLEMLVSDDAQQILNFLKDNPDFAGDISAVPTLQPIGDYVKILILQYESLYQDLDILELRYEATRLQTRLIENYVKNQKHLLSTELQTADDNKTNELLQKVKELDKLLNRTREV